MPLQQQWTEVEGGKKEKIIGWAQRIDASMWIYTKAVVCNGQNHMQIFRIVILRFVMGAVRWVYDDALDEHVWVTEQTIHIVAGSKRSGSTAI